MTKFALSVKVLRYDPSEGETPHYATYTVSRRETMSLLEVLEEIYLQDPTLTFSYSCRTGKCGTCTVRLDGKPVLACRQPVEDKTELVVEPIASFPVYKDLLVDRDRFNVSVRESLPDRETSQKPKAESRAAIRESVIPYQALTNCNSCLSCDSLCPVRKAVPDLYPGPATTAMIAGPGSRTLSSRGESVGAPVGSSIDYCAFCLNCDDACPWDVPFHRLNAVAKQAYLTERGWDLHDEITGRIGELGKIMSHVPGAGAIQRSEIAKALMEWFLDFDRHIELPPFKRDLWIRDHYAVYRGDGSRVAFFVGCFGRYIDPELGKATIEVLKRNRVLVTVPKQQCCGMPPLSKGRLTETRKMAEHNVRSLRSFVEQGYDIVASCTSCSWMLKKGYPDTLQLDDASDIAARTYDLGEYLLGLKNSGLLDTDFKRTNLSLAYHTPCHLRSQEIGRPFLEILGSIPGITLTDATRPCCGLSGTYGFKKNKYGIAMTVGRELFEAIKASGADHVVSECGMCRTQITHGTALNTSHPIKIIHAAYGASDFPLRLGTNRSGHHSTLATGSRPV